MTMETKKKTEEIKDIPKSKWLLLQDKLKATSECQVEYKEDLQCLFIDGRDITSNKSYIIRLLQTVKKVAFTLSSDMKLVLSMKKVTETKFENTYFDVQENTLNIYSLENIEDKLEEIKDKILHTKSISIPPHMPVSMLTKCYKYVQNKEYSVILSWDKFCTSITVIGLKSDVPQTLKDLQIILDEYKWVSGSCLWEGKKASYINRFAKEKIINLLQKITYKNIKILSDSKILIEFQCQKSYKMQLEHSLNSYTKSIMEMEVDLSKFRNEDLALICNNLKSDPEFLQTFEKTNNCCIFIEDRNDIELMCKVSKKKIDISSEHSGQKKSPSIRNKKKKKKANNLETPCVINIFKGGNILEEKSELLVCPIDISMRMDKLNVSKAFSKIDDNLQNEIQNSIFSDNGVYIHQVSLTDIRFCKAIAFIKLDKWQSGKSDQDLGRAVAEILNMANQLCLTSVSFPPLGTGRAFNYPVVDTAQAIIKAIDSFLKEKSTFVNIKKIYLVGGDKKLFFQLSKAGDELPHLKIVKKLDLTSDDHLEPISISDCNVELEYEMQSNPIVPPLITIVKIGCIDIVSTFLQNVEKKWLFEDYLDASLLSCWPTKFTNEVIETAIDLGVWVNKMDDPKTKQQMFRIKGTHNNVIKMKNSIYDTLAKYAEDLPRKHLFSQSTPQRGTVEFIQHAANCDEQFPTYWNLKVKDQPQGLLLVDVEAKMKAAIAELVDGTWNASRVGQGYDAANISKQSKLEVTDVQRIENPSLFIKYFMKRKLILQEIEQRGRVSVDASEIENSQGPADTMLILKNSMKQELLHEVNEIYLFHGTRQENVKSIYEQGIDNRLSNVGGMFGQGVYLAESSTKADQYADDRDNREQNGSSLTMLLTRVTLGDVFLCNDSHQSVQSRDSQKLRRPPCLSCEEDVCSCSPARSYHSVLGDGRWLFREFVVYEKDQCYPEYLITYHRICP